MFFSKDKKNYPEQELYERCYPKVFSAVNLILRDPELAKDAVQESFYKALCKTEQLREPSKFCAWVTSIAVNLAKDMLRNRSRQILIADREFSEVFANSNAPPDPVSDSVLRKYDVETVLAKLNPAEREILVLKYFLDYSTEEIANSLKTSTPNVLQRLRRAREKYRKFAQGEAAENVQEYEL